jgi:hypothetical protein
MNILTKSLTHSNINVKLAKILNVHFKKLSGCKMQFMSNEFKAFKVNDSIHVKMLIVQEM